MVASAPPISRHFLPVLQPDPPAWLTRVYNLILGSMIHDIGNLHGLFGPPRRVLSAGSGR
jgi:hypothetical protein